MANFDKLLDAPIPGQSLTAEVGSRPWQQPAKYNTVEDALEFYANKITNPKINDSLLDALEMGTPVTSIAEIVVQTGAMEGMHTIDVSILILPVIMELIAYVADKAEIDYSMGTEDDLDQDIVSESKIEMIMERLKKKQPEMRDEEPIEIKKESPPVSGLMARPVGNMGEVQGEM